MSKMARLTGGFHGWRDSGRAVLPGGAAASAATDSLAELLQQLKLTHLESMLAGESLVSLFEQLDEGRPALLARGLEASGHHLVCDLLCQGGDLPLTWRVRGSVHAMRPEWKRRLVLRYEPLRARQHAHHIQQYTLLLRHRPPAAEDATTAGQATTLVSSLLTSANLSSFAWGSQCALGAPLELGGVAQVDLRLSVQQRLHAVGLGTEGRLGQHRHVLLDAKQLGYRLLGRGHEAIGRGALAEQLLDPLDTASRDRRRQRRRQGVRLHNAAPVRPVAAAARVVTAAATAAAVAIQ